MRQKWIHVGSNMILPLRFAVCCQNCKHCISQTPCDDPTQYACARLSRPKREPPMVFGIGSAAYRKKCRDVRLWWARHFVAAGTVCDDFMPSTVSQMVEYEDDDTRDDDRQPEKQ